MFSSVTKGGSCRRRSQLSTPAFIGLVYGVILLTGDLLGKSSDMPCPTPVCR